jgi:lauroyl/myristoyl acyltransferase
VRSLAFTRHLSRLLIANGIVCVAGDATLGRRHVPLTFLGAPDRFPTGVVTLAKTTGAAVLPAFCLRAPHGRSRVVIEPPLAVPPDLDRDRGVEEVLRRFVTRLERYARRHPSSYLNWHLVGGGGRYGLTARTAISTSKSGSS